jgi:hypothetical protein
MIVNAVSAAVTNIVGVGEMQRLRQLQENLTALARQLLPAASSDARPERPATS